MESIVFLFVGLVLVVVGLIVSQSHGMVIIQHHLADQASSQMVRYAVGGGLGGLGIAFLLLGLRGQVLGSQQAKQNQFLMQNGIDAEGTVTFVDKNYSLLVNNRPVYSIIEYTYTDAAGKQHTRKIANADSERVIRMGLQVGTKVPIKYSAQNPAESVIILG